MLLRSSRFYLSGYLYYYEHIRLPQLWWYAHTVRVSHVHVQPSIGTQHYITPGSPCFTNYRYNQAGQQVSSYPED